MAFGAVSAGVGDGASSAEGCDVARRAALGRFENFGRDGHPCRLGIMGGTFDPIHNGHLAIARHAMAQLRLAGVLFVVAGDPWMKHGRAITTAEDRFAMVRAAVAGEARFEASRMEIDRLGETYTADTLRALHDFLPNSVELYFLVGADALAQLPAWHDAPRLGSLARFAAVSREGMPPLGSEALAKAAGAIGASEIELVSMPAMDVSSTDLREKARRGLSVRDQVPADVADYIEMHGLYR